MYLTYPKPLHAILWNKSKERLDVCKNNVFLYSSIRVWDRHKGRLVQHISPASVYIGQSWFQTSFNETDLQTWGSHCTVKLRDMAKQGVQSRN